MARRKPGGASEGILEEGLVLTVDAICIWTGAASARRMWLILQRMELSLLVSGKTQSGSVERKLDKDFLLGVIFILISSLGFA